MSADVEAFGRDLNEALDRLIRLYSHADAERGWMLWIDGWGEALRNPTLQRISQDLDFQWQQVVHRQGQADERTGDCGHGALPTLPGSLPPAAQRLGAAGIIA